MNVYMPPQRRETMTKRREIRRHVRDYLGARGVSVISRTGGARSLPWLRQADAMVLETNNVTPEDENECLFMATELGRQVLVLFDRVNLEYGGEPSDTLVEASRRDGNENSNIWVVRHGPLAGAPYAVVDSTLQVFTEAELHIKTHPRDFTQATDRPTS